MYKVGDRYEDEGSVYEVTEVQTEIKDDGTKVIVVSSISVDD